MVKRSPKFSIQLKVTIAISATLIFVAGTTYISCRRFRRRVMEETCGVKPGMSLAEAEHLLEDCGEIQRGPDPRGYAISPRWLAAPAGWDPAAYYGIYLEVDAQGKIKRAAPTEAYDF